MSGKSTFLRTLALNSILAQTIYTCFADEYISPILKQFSSIRIDDNLFEGKSYYFQEVNIMASLISAVNLPQQNLFVLDEVFKGTNTVERIAAAKALLSYLNRNDNIVVVSTHDIELADLLESEYDLYHFTEIVESNELHFDHSIKPGQLKTRNAIKILELSNFPTDLVSEARRISTTLRTAKVMNTE
jgi:DNA mismatch repair ATPase MutS